MSIDTSPAAECTQQTVSIPSIALALMAMRLAEDRVRLPGVLSKWGGPFPRGREPHLNLASTEYYRIIDAISRGEQL